MIYKMKENLTGNLCFYLIHFTILNFQDEISGIFRRFQVKH